MTYDQALNSSHPMTLKHWTFWVLWDSGRLAFIETASLRAPVNISAEDKAGDWSILVCEKHHIVIRGANPTGYYTCLKCTGCTPVTKEDERAFEMLNAAKQLTPKCECGAEACRSPMHSEWCPIEQARQ